jgi:hypothetical protein
MDIDAYISLVARHLLVLHSVHAYCAIHRISRAVQVIDNSESTIIMITSKGEYVFRQSDSEMFMKPVQETNRSTSAELVLGTIRSSQVL